MLAGPSVEPGPMGLPSQAAKPRSEGVESFRSPAQPGRLEIVAAAPVKTTEIGAEFEPRQERRRLAVHEIEGRVGARRET